MKKFINVRELLLSTGNIKSSGKENPAIVRGANRPSKPVSKLNAIIARRAMTSH